MNREHYTLAAAALHDMLDARQAAAGTVDSVSCLLRLVADDMESDAGVGHAVTFTNARQVSDPANSEFWRRLAGSLRKACGMI